MSYNYIKNSDKEIYDILFRELNREHNTLALSASENFRQLAKTSAEYSPKDNPAVTVIFELSFLALIIAMLLARMAG